MLLLRSHERFAELIAKNQFAYLMDDALPVPSCQQPAVCNAALRKAAVDSWSPRPRFDAALDIYQTLLFVMKPWVCSPCRESTIGKFASGKTASWSALPGVFGLPAWDDLRNFAFD